MQVRLSIVAALATLGAAGWAAEAPAQAPGEPELASHRAVYDLKLAESRGKQSVQSARGRILYDFAGNACEGYALQFRQVTELDSGEGKVAVSDLRSTNWEEGQGKSFRFASTSFLNNQPTEAAEGRAAQKDGKVAIEVSKPQPKQFEAADVIFPSEHMRRIIAAAREGKSLLEVGVYDGAETGERLYNTLTVIGQPIGPERPATDAAAGQPALAGLKRWPVRVSYFDRAKADSDQTPLYSISFEAYENGVSRALKLDYGEFVLTG
ncbi:MAG TPA: cell envelope integrity EipB family protein, partial [Xanthobacteraceae bacterium]